MGERGVVGQGPYTEMSPRTAVSLAARKVASALQRPPTGTLGAAEKTRRDGRPKSNTL